MTIQVPGGPLPEDRETILVCRVGRMEYRSAWSLQQAIQRRLIHAKRANPPTRLPHALLLVEHPPVYTMGKSGDIGNLLFDEEQLRTAGIDFVQIDRGGDITYHGPGQLVGYPILDLDRFFTDIHRYLRELEEAIIRSAAEFGVTAGRVDGRTGVWVGPDERGPERKICAMGIRCSRWVTMHGFALNIRPDLTHFQGIVPCGIEDRDVTSLSVETLAPLTTDAVGDAVVRHLADRFDADTRTVNLDTIRRLYEA